MPSTCPQAHRRRRAERGYTLIEIMVALSVITVGLLGIFQVLSGTILTNVDSRNRSVATHFCEEKMEAVRSTPFSALASTTPAGDAALQYISNDARWYQTVTPVPAGASPVSLLSVTVRVQWKHQGILQTVRLDTLVHRDGINSIR